MADIPAWVDGTLQPVEKLAVHRRGLRHVAISIFVTRGDAILLQQRAAGKYHTPLLWANSVCTHPHWGEDTGTTAVRRLDEELGITGLTPAFVAQVEYRAEVGGGMIEHEVVDIFTARAPADLSIRPNPEEVAGIRWATQREIAREIAAYPQRFTPWMRIYMAEHADRILGA